MLFSVRSTPDRTGRRTLLTADDYFRAQAVLVSGEVLPAIKSALYVPVTFCMSNN